MRRPSNRGRWIVDSPREGVICRVRTRRLARRLLRSIMADRAELAWSRVCPGFYSFAARDEMHEPEIAGVWLVYTVKGLQRHRLELEEQLRAAGITRPLAAIRGRDGV